MNIFKCIILINYPKTIRVPMDSKLQEEDAMWHQISSLCGPHSLHVSPCSIATSIFSCIYLISYIIKYLSHSNVWTSFIISLIKIPNVSIWLRELVVLRREIPMAWGTTTDSLTPEINPFLYARETKQLTLKDLDSYLIPDGWCRSPLSFPTSTWIDELLPQHSINKTSMLYIIVLDLL